jgi:hypothetical protein
LQFVTLNGLNIGEQATLRLWPDEEGNAAVALAEQYVTNGQNILPSNLFSLPDGSYQLILDAPSTYFRDPKGYLFQVTNGQMLLNDDLTDAELLLTFDLTPPSAQEYPPCNESHLSGGMAVDRKADLTEEPNIVCMDERMISLSAHPRQGEEPVEGESDYYYVGPKTTRDNRGVWGRFTVVNPTVCHPCSASDEFVVVRVYANNYGAGPQRWMEAGWAEHSTRDNTRYIYEYDSVDRVWNFFQSLADGSQLEVVVYHQSGTEWRAIRALTGGGWAILRKRDLGFKIAWNGYNRGEINLGDATFPILPSVTFNKNDLLIDGIWIPWDTQFYTATRNDGPYDTHYTNQYYNFYIHTH